MPRQYPQIFNVRVSVSLYFSQYALVTAAAGNCTVTIPGLSTRPAIRTVRTQAELSKPDGRVCSQDKITSHVKVMRTGSKEDKTNTQRERLGKTKRKIRNVVKERLTLCLFLFRSHLSKTISVYIQQ